MLLSQHCQKYGEVCGDKQVSLREKMTRGVVKYLCLARTAVVVIISTAIVANVTVDGAPPVNIAGVSSDIIFWLAIEQCGQVFPCDKNDI